MAGVPVLVGTTHLESPTGHRQLYSEQRVEQCKQVQLATPRPAPLSRRSLVRAYAASLAVPAQLVCEDDAQQRQKRIWGDPSVGLQPFPPGLPLYASVHFSGRKAAWQSCKSLARAGLEGLASIMFILTFQGKKRSIILLSKNSSILPAAVRSASSRAGSGAWLQGALLMSQVSKGDDVVLAGDMNWGPGDGQPPLPDGWYEPPPPSKPGAQERAASRSHAPAGPAA